MGAWAALESLEEQLSRADNTEEDPSVRQASAVLKQMLRTLADLNNPGLLGAAQMMVPEFSRIWAHDVTRGQLIDILHGRSRGTSGSSATNASSSAAGGGSADF